MLSRVYIDNFRCLVNFECRFDRVQLLLGSNGGGKSTLFDALMLIRGFSVNGEPIEQSFGAVSRTRWQDVPEQTFEVDLLGNGGRYSFRLTVDTVGRPARPRVVKEELSFNGQPIFKFSQGDVHLFNDEFQEKVAFPFDWHRSALATISERPENTLLTWFKKAVGRFLFISPDPRRMSSLAESEAPVPDVALSNFASWYRHIRLENDDRSLLDDLREVIPSFESMDLKDLGLGNRILSLTFSGDHPNGQMKRYNNYFHELSDGQRVLIGLYTVLNFAITEGATLFFDEPENFLALKEVAPWFSRIIDKAEDVDAQLFFISHHPELLNRLATTSGVVFERQHGRQTRVAKFEDVDNTGLTAAELVERGWENE